MKAENHTQKAQLQEGCGRVRAYHILGKKNINSQLNPRLGWGTSLFIGVTHRTKADVSTRRLCELGCDSLMKRYIPRITCLAYRQLERTTGKVL